MAYIQHIDSITYQDSFQNKELWSALNPLAQDASLQNPDYKLWINPAALRRLSTILRMGIATAKSCVNEEPFDGVSYGTSLGCLTDTEKFLQVINTVTGDVFSPTAFIQSTHNTIAGQISLELKNHAYNMTHTQNTLSFEVALLDGMLLLQEGKKNVLVGAADEYIPFLDRLQPDLIATTLPLTSGATSICLSATPKAPLAEIVVCKTQHQVQNEKEAFEQFLEQNQLTESMIDHVFVAQALPFQ